MKKLALLAAFVLLATGCETFQDARPHEAGKPSVPTPAPTAKAEGDKPPEWPALVPREKWKCDDLELVAYEFTGTATIAGHTERTDFRIDGIERRWNWCLAKDGSYDCAVTISPDGWGRYFNFRGTDGTAKPSDSFRCHKQ